MLYIIRYLIQFISLSSFVDCGVRISSRFRVRVKFYFFVVSCTLKERKLARGQVPQRLSCSVFDIAVHRSWVRSPAIIIF